MNNTTQLINNRFGGIRRKSPEFNEQMISCSDCQNVELFYTRLNSGVGLRTANGNRNITITDVGGVPTSCIPDDEEVVGVFESNQAGNTVIFVYTENETVGKLYTYTRLTNTLTQLDLTPALGSGVSLQKSDKCEACGVDFEQPARDWFIFSNGKSIIYIYTDISTPGTLVVESASNLDLEDVEGETVNGLGLCVWGTRLWVFNEKTLWYSRLAVPTEFNYQDPYITSSAGLIIFAKPITAFCPYLGSLAVFHKDSSVLITDNATTLFEKSDESPGGCAGYNSLVFHGTDLFFYDDTKKGVFSFRQIINGDKTLGENIAEDLQDELSKINHNNLQKIRCLSVVTSDRNEVWFLVPLNVDEYSGSTLVSKRSLVFIYDYIRNEWIKRKCQHINGMCILDSKLYSYGKEIYVEYSGTNFDGEWIPAYYTCSVFNLGTDNTLKITKFPPRITVDGDYRCKFWVTYKRNYSPKKTKEKLVFSKQNGGHFKWNDGTKLSGMIGTQYYDGGGTYLIINTNTIVKLPSATFKAIEINFETKEQGQQFAIKAIEMSKIKVKQV